MSSALVPDLAHLAHVAHGPYGKTRLLLMLTAYLDESHDVGGENSAYVIAGYLAPTERWNCLWGAWDRALAEEDIPEMHYSDCVSGNGKIFGGMTEARREAIQRRFIDIINSPQYELVGFICGMEVKPYDALRQEIEEAGQRLPPRAPVSGPISDHYFLSFQSAVEMMANFEWVAKLPDAEQIAFVFDRRGDLQGRASYLYQRLCEHPLFPAGKRLGTLAFADRKRIKPLQAADMLANEAFRYLSMAVRRGTGILSTLPPPRWQFAELWKRVYGGAQGFNEESLRVMIRRQMGELGGDLDDDTLLHVIRRWRREMGWPVYPAEDDDILKMIRRHKGDLGP